jgi:hypothetical protein
VSEATEKTNKPDKKKKDAVNANLPPEIIIYLRRLKRSGLYGKALGTIARTLIQDQIKALIADGSLRMEFAEHDGPDDHEEDTD